MSPLFIRLFGVMVITLVLVGGLIYFFLENPVFTRSEDDVKQELENILDDLNQRLEQVGQFEWEVEINTYPLEQPFSFEYFELEQDQLSPDDFGYFEPGTIQFERYDIYSISARQYVGDTNIVVEVNFDYLIAARSGYNLIFIIVLSIVVAALISWLALIPITRRLYSLEIAAQKFMSAKWDYRSSDDRPDVIGRLSGSMNTMAERIQKLVADKDLLLSEQEEIMQAVAHEFRGPMARIRFALEMSESEVSLEEQAELREDIHSGLDDMNLLVTEVLRYARLQKPVDSLEVEEVDIVALTEDIHHSVKNLHSDKKIIDNYSHLMPVLAKINKQQFDRALSNLIINAIKYGHKLVKISVTSDPVQFQVSVEDDGIGIPGHLRERIFEPFTRLDTSRSRETGGTGLGLALVKRICEKHRGSIAVTDSDLGGVNLTMTWPKE